MSEPNPHVEHRIEDYLHDLLGPPEAEEVARHCKACPSCQAALEAACRLLDALRQAAAPPPASEGLVQATLGRVTAHERARRRRRVRLAWAVAGPLAASLLVLLGMQFYYERLTPTPYDLL